MQPTITATLSTMGLVRRVIVFGDKNPYAKCSYGDPLEEIDLLLYVVGLQMDNIVYENFDPNTSVQNDLTKKNRNGVTLGVWSVTFNRSFIWGDEYTVKVTGTKGHTRTCKDITVYHSNRKMTTCRQLDAMLDLIPDVVSDINEEIQEAFKTAQPVYGISCTNIKDGGIKFCVEHEFNYRAVGSTENKFLY